MNDTHPKHSPNHRANSKHNDGVSQTAERKHSPVKGQHGNLGETDGECVEDSKEKEVQSRSLQRLTWSHPPNISPMQGETITNP